MVTDAKQISWSKGGSVHTLKAPITGAACSLILFPIGRGNSFFHIQLSELYIKVQRMQQCHQEIQLIMQKNILLELIYNVKEQSMLCPVCLVQITCS